MNYSSTMVLAKFDYICYHFFFIWGCIPKVTFRAVFGIYCIFATAQGCEFMSQCLCNSR